MLKMQDWGRYIGKRLLLMIPILIGVSLLVFSIMELTPGDPVTRKLGTEATPEAVEVMRTKMGLDKGPVERYVIYVKNVVTKLDFGTSWRTDRPVFEEIGGRFAVSIRIAILAIILSTVIGIPLGVFSAVKQNTAADNIMRVLSTVFVAMPSFWLAMLMSLLFTLTLAILPASDDGTFRSYILPVLSTAFPGACRTLRLTRSSMLECIREDYVRTARAKGVPSRTVIYKHALQNALLPVVTTIGETFGIILGGSIIAESVFTMPGMGLLIVLSIRSKDTPVILASVIMLAFFFSLVILIVDLILAMIDPRIKAKIIHS